MSTLESRVKRLEDKVFGTTAPPESPPPLPIPTTTKYGVQLAYKPKGTIYYEVQRTYSGSDSIRDNITTAVELINTEAVGYFKTAKAPTNSGMQCKLRGGQHYTDPSKSDEGACYAPAIRLNTGTPHLRYEDGHPYYKTIKVTPLKTFGNLAGKWFGMRNVITNLPDGNVRIEQWIDPPFTTFTTAPQKWVKTLDYVDKTYKQLKKRGQTFKTTFRLDDSEFESKFLSANEIVV
jgi:hypothetical protein